MKLNSLIDSAQADALTLQALKSDIEAIRQGVKITLFDDSILATFQNLLEVPINHLAHCQRDVLKSLAFDDMYSRYDSVPEAHFKTCEWIFNSNIRPSFVNWLNHGDGIFHISGKLGSGKSTLMKFLCEDHRAEKELREWSGK